MLSLGANQYAVNLQWSDGGWHAAVRAAGMPVAVLVNRAHRFSLRESAILRG